MLTLFFSDPWLKMSCWSCRIRTPLMLAALMVVLVGNGRATAERVVRLINGLELQGDILELASISENPFQAAARGGEVETRPLWVIDDGLRRTYLHQRAMVASTPDVFVPQPERIDIEQPVPVSGRPLSTAGTIFRIGEFNEFGRRVLVMQGPEGPLTIIQGMTQITPDYVKLEALSAEHDIVWESRIATDSVSDAVLESVFEHWAPAATLEGRLRIVQLFLQAERYAAARRQIDKAIAAYPDQAGLLEQRKALVQRQARQILDEATLRAARGQPQLARRMLNGFPRQGIAREIQLQVADAIKQQDDEKALAAELVKQLRELIASLSDAMQADLQAIVDEIERDLNTDTLARLSDFRRLGGEDTITAESRVSLAIGGWLLGSGSGLQNLPVARSLVLVRNKVAEYLAESDAQRRQKLLEELRGLEGATPEYVSKMLPLMRPPLTLPDEAADPDVPGLYHMTLPAGAGDETFEYSLQLPPEYSPLRSYPCVVALAPLGSDPDWEIDWWAGPYRQDLQMRGGQATRQGYVVVSPRWSTAEQTVYNYTSVEHARVMASVRDAMRRVSIDSDRVYLSGHGYSAAASDGASAAWDIGLAHPDIWAGIMVIGGEAEKYIQHYSPNGKYVPIYFVMGEIAGAPKPPLARNGPDLNRYLRPGFDAMIVGYRGRGAEHFFEEIPHLFEWMELRSHRRGAMPKNLDLVTMRRGDQFFWWLELPELLDAAAVNPILYGREGRLSAAEINAKVTGTGDVQIVQAPASSYTVYLSPEMGVDLGNRVTVSRSRSLRSAVTFDGSLDVMLEDVRTRADRKHPFWAKVTLP